MHALRHTKGDAVIQCDNWSVCRTFSKGPSAKPIYNSLLWHEVFVAARERFSLGFGCLTVEWIKSHTRADVAVLQGVCPYKWNANAAADLLANRAAELVQHASEDLGIIKARSELSKLVLRRLVAIAIKLAPASSAGARVIKVAGRQEDKAKLVDLWARRSGHTLDHNFQCCKCKLRLDMSRNLAFLEAVLELNCITSNKSVSYQLVHLPREEDEDIFLFHRLKVHRSHKVATHFGLRIHFCTRCGSYGQPSGKSVGLAKTCVAPTRQGRQALNNILKGKWPAYIGKDVLERVPKLPKDLMDSYRNVQHPGRDAPSNL